MDRSERVILTNLCMIYKDDQLLLQNRLKKDWQGYAFPGGHVEEGESFVDSVVREVKEETGLDIEDVRLCGIKQFPTEDGLRYIVVLFKTDKFSGTLRSSPEGENKWVKRQDLDKYDLVVDFYDMLEAFDNDQINEFIYLREAGKLKRLFK